MHVRVSVCMTVVAFGSAPTFAAESAWYLGLSAGSMSSDISIDQVDTISRNSFNESGLNVQTVGTSSLDDSDSAWSVLAGYRFTPNFSLEAAYVDLGNIAYRYDGEAGRVGGTIIPPRPAVLAPATSTVDIDNSGLSLKGVAAAPLGDRLDVHAHVGVAWLTSEVLVSGGASAAGVSFSGSRDDDSVELSYGAGAGYRLGSKWALSLDWQRFDDIGPDGATANYDAITLALLFTL
jgi:OOP family OmpA-OmpF porin